MSFKAVILNNPCGLKIKNGNIQITLWESNEKVMLPIGDVATILLDNPNITLTKSFLSECSKNNIAIIITDEYHMPCGVTLPQYSYFKSSNTIDLQINLKQNLKDRLWQSLVRNKILNQASVLRLLGKGEYTQLENLNNQVLSGDKNNIEAQAARIYFIALFNKDFNRSQNNLINQMLNYGYAIIRSSVAKSLSSRGFHCSLGLHHKSILNAFNLVDDMMEPYRAIVDYYVYKYVYSQEGALVGEIKKEHKELLINILHKTVIIIKGEYRLLTSFDLQVESLLSSYRENNNNLITIIFKEG